MMSSDSYNNKDNKKSIIAAQKPPDQEQEEEEVTKPQLLVNTGKHPTTTITTTTTSSTRSSLSPTATPKDSPSSQKILHSPIPTKPPLANQFKPQLGPSPKEQTPNTTTTTTMTSTAKRERMPSLVVKQDPTLKSCLSNSTEPINKILQQEQRPRHQSNPSLLNNEVHHLENHHPQFLITTDNISPNMHGLIDLNNPGPLIGGGEMAIDEITGNQISFTPISQAESISSSIASPNSKSDSSPVHQIDIITGGGGPPPSRMNSLRYSEDKKVSDILRHSYNNSRSSSICGIPGGGVGEDIQMFHQQNIICEDNKIHLLFGITGCITIHKNIFLIIEKLFELYTREKLEIQIILTKSAEFILLDKLNKLEQLGVSKIWFHDDGEKFFLTSPFQKMILKVVNNATTTSAVAANLQKHRLTPQLLLQYSLSYELQKWTDILLICPLSANTMAKLINGLADNLLTEVLHVWPIPHMQLQPPPPPPPTQQLHAPQQQSQLQPHGLKVDISILENTLPSPKPIIAVLALTNAMYSHPITKKQLVLLQETYPNMSVLKPVEKCIDIDGNISMGGMRAWREVVDFVSQKLGPPPEPEDDDDDEQGEDEEDEIEEEDNTNDGEDLDNDDEDDDEDEEEDDSESIELLENFIVQKKKSRSRSPVTTLTPQIAQLEIHNEHERLLSPILTNESKLQVNDKNDGINGEVRRRSSTISRKELEEHEKLASANALLNTGIRIVSPSGNL